MRVPYIVGAGSAFGEPAKSHKTRSAILSCMVGAGVGIGLRLVLDSNRGIIANILSVLEVVGIAIWDMLTNMAQFCADFARYVLSTMS